MVSINGEVNEASRIAAVSSFGAGGSNGHIIIEEFRQDTNNEEIGKLDAQIFLLSAKEAPILKESANGLLKFISNHDNLDINLQNILNEFANATDKDTDLED